MPDSFLHHAPTSGIIRHKILIRMRWLAIAGQAGAILIGALVFALPLDLWQLSAVVVVSVLFNFVSMGFAKRNPSLRNKGAALSLAFDTLQLTVLLHLTGGIGNPFCILMLSPMLVAATLLTGRSTIFIFGLGIACLSVLRFTSSPLVWPNDALPPPLYLDGVYIALIVSALFLGHYVRKVARESRRLSEALNVSRLALEREQKISAFGALAAAVAHEFGSPLSTMAVIAKELGHDPANGAAADDIKLLSSEIERCRVILSDLGRHNVVADASAARLPLVAWLKKIAEPYQRDGTGFTITVTRGQGEEPLWPLQPALMHGVANPLQNAFHFAQSTVRLEVGWEGAHVSIAIIDDGPGFPPHLIGRLGDAYISAREEEDNEGHLGLGLFIARALLQRSGASLDFSNVSYSDGTITGAKVIMEWRVMPV